MKSLKLSGIVLLILFLLTEPVFSQETTILRGPDTEKPTQFDEYPEKIPVNINELKSLFGQDAARGPDIILNFTEKKFPGFDGKVISLSDKYNNSIRSVVIRSTRFNGATLTLSSSTTPDGAARYHGRIISFQHGDSYELKKEDEQYYFIKKKLNELVNE